MPTDSATLEQRSAIRSILLKASTNGNAESRVHFPLRRRSKCLSRRICSISSTTSSSGSTFCATCTFAFLNASIARSRISLTASLITCISSDARLERFDLLWNSFSAHSAMFCAWSATRSNSPQVCSSSEISRLSLSESSFSERVSR